MGNSLDKIALDHQQVVNPTEEKVSYYAVLLPRNSDMNLETGIVLKSVVCILRHASRLSFF